MIKLKKGSKIIYHYQPASAQDRVHVNKFLTFAGVYTIDCHELVNKTSGTYNVMLKEIPDESFNANLFDDYGG